jgi:hypothetical protein
MYWYRLQIDWDYKKRPIQGCSGSKEEEKAEEVNIITTLIQMTTDVLKIHWLRSAK